MRSFLNNLTPESAIENSIFVPFRDKPILDCNLNGPLPEVDLNRRFQIVRSIWRTSLRLTAHGAWIVMNRADGLFFPEFCSSEHENPNNLDTSEPETGFSEGTQPYIPVSESNLRTSTST